jgi:DegV family protein with EDD domain
MEYLTHNELKKMMLFSFERIAKNKEEIDKINIFPVPDKDTGTNFLKTLLGIKKAIEKKEFKNLAEISNAALDGALTFAQGNVGVIFTAFLAGFLKELDKNPVGAEKLALAFEKGAKKARESIQEPKEGTILDAIEAVSQSFKREAEKEKNIVNILKKALIDCQKAVLATREKMEIFKKAKVVDAGALGFFLILKSYLEALEGRENNKEKEKGKGKESFQGIKKFIQIIPYRYEVVFLLKNEKLDEKDLKRKLENLGNSLEVLKIGEKTKVHIHTDFPEEVKEIAKKAGQIEDLRIEDMTKEIAGEESVKKISIGIVTENITMFPPEFLKKYQIVEVPVKYEWLEEKELPGENIYQKMREAEKRGIKTFPKTSQATPKDYFEAFEKQLKRFDQVLGIILSSRLSGCYNSAKQAQNMVKEPERIFVLDSLTAAAGQAFLILKTLELIKEQREIEEIIEKLKKEIPKIHFYVLFEDPKWIESIGRISKFQANWIRRMKKLRLWPIIQLKEGILKRGGIVFAKSPSEALFKKILKESKKIRKKKKIEVIIGQADNLSEAEKLKKMLEEKIGAEVLFLGEGPAIICAAAGPGTLLVSWKEKD